MATTSQDIADLIAKVAIGDRRAFEALYSATSAKLFGVTLRILKNQTEAEEALQEVYIKIWQRADQYKRGQYSPISWLVAIARNHALDVLRARKPTSDGVDAAMNIAAADPTPEQAAVNNAERKVIDVCLDQLDTDKADAVRSAYLDGFSYQELADRYDVPINTMRTWLRRSLMKLKDCMTA